MKSKHLPACLQRLLLVLVFLVQPLDSVLSQERASVVDLDNVIWGPPGGGNGFPVGVQTARVGIDESTQGITYYAKFPAGSRFDLHWHTHHEYVAVMQGEVDIRLGDTVHRVKAGSYIVIPGQLNHSWQVPDDAAVVILVRRAGPADFHFVDQSL